MSNPESSIQPADEPEEKPSKGINLILIYSLLALSLIAALGIALLIVLPFYHRR
jgi:hypothetical protein